MLVPVEVELLEDASYPNRIGVGVIGSPGVVHENHLVAHRLAHRVAGLDVPFDMGRSRRSGLPGGRIPVVVGVDLVRGVAEVLALDRIGGVLLRRAQIIERAGVRLDLVPSTAEQMVDREARRPDQPDPKGRGRSHS